MWQHPPFVEQLPICPVVVGQLALPVHPLVLPLRLIIPLTVRSAVLALRGLLLQALTAAAAQKEGLRPATAAGCC